MGKVLGRGLLARKLGVTSATIRWLEEQLSIGPKEVYHGGVRFKEYNHKNIQDLKRILEKRKKTPIKSKS